MRIATPLSTLFRDADDASRSRLLELSDALEVRDHIGAYVSSDLPRLYHCELSIVAPWSDEEVAAVAKVAIMNVCKLVSFHALADFSDPKRERGAFVPSGVRMGEDVMLANARENIARVRFAAGERIYLVENNNHFPTGAYDTVTSPTFLSALVEALDVGLLLDIGHAEITAKHIGSTLEAYVGALPLERVRQIHLSGITRGKDRYIDAHDELQEADWRQFGDIRARCPSLEYATIEYYQEPAKLITMLERLRTYV